MTDTLLAPPTSTPEPGYITTRLRAANVSSAERVRRDIELNIGPHLPSERDAAILEIGFGLAPLLDYLAAAGYRRYRGVDVDAEAVALAQGRHPVELVADAAEHLLASGERYDGVILRDVIAHLAPDAGTILLRSVRHVLRPGGVAVLQTFNGALPTAAYTRANDLTHRTAYTEHSLRQLLLLAGFQSIEVLPGRLATRGFRGAAFLAARSVYCRTLRVRYALERGLGGNPTIYTRALIGVARP